MNLRQLHNQDDSSASSYWATWVENRQNSTAYINDDDEITKYNDSTGTVLALGVLLFVLVSAAIACVRVRAWEETQQSGAHAASDGQTVASAEDKDDLEEGQSKALENGNDDNKDMPVVVVVVRNDQDT